MATEMPSATAPAALSPAAHAVAGAASARATGSTSGEAVVRVPGNRFVLFNAVPSWLISMLVHMVGLLLLAMINVGSGPPDAATELRIVSAEETPPLEDLDAPEEIVPVDVPVLTSQPVLEPERAQMPEDALDIGVALDLEAAPLAINLVEFSERTAPRSDLIKDIGALGGSGLEGRGGLMRGELLRRYGGSAGSEEAVALALQWLAEHQLQDGSWSFDHRGGSCAGRCSAPGTVKDCYTGGTAIALLPFLGAGQTHLEGQYRSNVAAGLAFLIRSMNPNGSLMQGGGTMYAHGLGSIALCEAYAMTGDQKLMAPAQASLNFIAFSQDPVGGGWRYQPRQAGDTSVVGWQLMALKSGHMANLQVSPATVMLASRFLDSVQVDGGSGYGYSLPGDKPSTSSIGLLCRMYLGWKKDHEALQRGVTRLSARGPSRTDMYYNYYATQVLHHWEGEPWEKWNAVMRDQLVNSQAKDGHARGSWQPTSDNHSNQKGGRLYFTAMATMILEVYYRHMPIYGKQAADDEFPL